MKKILTLFSGLLLAANCQAASIMFLNQGNSPITCSGNCEYLPKTINPGESSVFYIEKFVKMRFQYKNEIGHGCSFNLNGGDSKHSASAQTVKLDTLTSCGIHKDIMEDYLITIDAWGYN